MMMTLKKEDNVKICFFGCNSFGCKKSDYEILNSEIKSDFVFLLQNIRKKKR